MNQKTAILDFEKFVLSLHSTGQILSSRDKHSLKNGIISEPNFSQNFVQFLTEQVFEIHRTNAFHVLHNYQNKNEVKKPLKK